MKSLLFIAIITLISACDFNRNSKATQAISSLPSFNILLLDSTTILSSQQIPKGNPIILMYFNTDCAHCKKETKSLLQKIDSIKNVQLYFMTGMSLNELKAYDNEFKLSSYKNIMVGKDYEHSFYRAFKPRSVPYIAIYNKEKSLVSIYNGGTSIGNILRHVRI